MIWRSRHVLILVFLWMGTTHSKSLENTKDNVSNNNRESASRSLSDSLHESKISSSSISHLLKSLESPSNSNTNEGEQERPLQIITKHGLITARESTISRNKSGRKLFFGDQSDSTSSGVPAPVVVSSQAIRISGGGGVGSGSNGTGNKRARSLHVMTPSAGSMDIDKSLDGVRTIEGVRVPDDEHDKFYTWRNARVIKNFLVPENRPANPQRKRQILIQDAQHYLSSQGVSSPLIDASSPQQSTIYFASPPALSQHQQQAASSSASSTTQFLQGQDLTAAIYAAAQQQQQVQQQASPSYQYQATPVSNGQQQATYTYSQATQQSTQPQQQGQVYVLQPDGKTYLPYTPAQSSPSAASPLDHSQYTAAGQQIHIQSQGQSSSQFLQRSGEVGQRGGSDSSEENDSGQRHSSSPSYQQQYQQFAALRLQAIQNEQQKQQQEQKEYQQHILSKHQNHFIQSTPIPTIIQTQQSQQSQHGQQQQPHVSINPYSGSGAATPLTNVSPSPSPSPTPATLMHKSSQSFQDITATAIPTGASIGAQLQEQVLQTAQYLQVQAPNGQNGGQSTLYQFAGASPALSQPPSILEERQSHVGGPSVVPGAVSGSQFVIHPHTYHTGGGQMFSVPVPIPADQVAQFNEQNNQHNNNQKSRDDHRHGHNNNGNNKKEGRPTFTDKLRESLQFNRKVAMEHVETSAVVPVLATTGIVLGLGALAADNSRLVGWSDKGPYSFGHWPTVFRPIHEHHEHGSYRRSISNSNDMTLQDSPESENPGFLHKILGSLEFSQSSLLNKLQEQGYSKWQESPCAQRIFCDVMASQNDDTVNLMEKRMVKFLSMLPDSLSQSLSKTLGDVMKSISKKDCSAFTCGGHWVDVTAIPQPSSPAYQPR